MARLQDVLDAELHAHTATKAAENAMADLELMMAFLRETEQVAPYMEWYAKKIGIWKLLYEPADVTGR